MKKILLILIVVVLLVFGLAFRFYRQQLTGVWPAVLTPKEDIAKQIEESVPPAETPGTSSAISGNQTDFPLALPKGFSISIFAKNLGKVRDLEWADGTLIASLTDAGKVVALPDRNGDGKADETKVIKDGLNQPHGLAFDCATETCRLYIAETDKVVAYDYNPASLNVANPQKLVDLDVGGFHYTRSLLLHPDGKRLLIASGSSCNVCDEESWQRAKILSVNLDGSDFKEYAKGLRNSVFMAVRPQTGEIWATDNGRDLLGDNLPPDEINIINEGANYGWPICYGKNIHDTEYDKNTYFRNPCMEPLETESHIDIQAHSAPLGLAFFPQEGWPAEYQNDLLVAFHGSWNRSVPTGYKIVRFRLDENGNSISQEDFVNGWLKPNDDALGRPVDILIRPDGTIYASDDKAGVVYRLTYQGQK